MYKVISLQQLIDFFQNIYGNKKKKVSVVCDFSFGYTSYDANNFNPSLYGDYIWLEDDNNNSIQVNINNIKSITQGKNEFADEYMINLHNNSKITFLVMSFS